jgi:hypothetical protein
MHSWTCASATSTPGIGSDFFGVLAAKASKHASAARSVLPQPIPWNAGRTDGTLPSEHGSSFLPGGGGGLGILATVAIVAFAAAVLLFAIRHELR